MKIVSAKIKLDEKLERQYEIAKKSRLFYFNELIQLALKTMEKQKIEKKKEWALNGFVKVYFKFHMNGKVVVPEKVGISFPEKYKRQKCINLYNVERFGSEQVLVTYTEYGSREVRSFKCKNHVVSEEIYDILGQKEVFLDKLEKEIENGTDV